jgi:hypothetical protein
MIDNKDSEQNEQLIKLALITLYVLLENCPNAMHENVGNITEVIFKNLLRFL